MSFRQHGGLPPNLEDTEVTDMTAYEILSLVVGIIGLVFSAILVVVTIIKDNRHQKCDLLVATIKFG